MITPLFYLVLFHSIFIFVSFETLDAGGFKIESNEDFDSIPTDEFNKHIAATTKFPSWEDMLSEATTQYTARKLGF